MQRARGWLLTAVVLTAFAGVADAAVVVLTESETTAPPAQGAAKPAKPQYRGTMYLDGERVRIEGTSATKDGEMEGTVLFRAQPESFVFLDAGKKSYTEMTREDRTMKMHSVQEGKIEYAITCTEEATKVEKSEKKDSK